MGMPFCQSCGDVGWFTYDGKPAACACPAGEPYRRRLAGAKSWEGTNNLPPGGEVMARQAARDAAHLPPGALDGVPVRAMLIDDQTMQAALAWVVRLAGELEPGNPTRKACAAWVETLPEAYRLTMPEIPAAPRRGRSRQAASRMTP